MARKVRAPSNDVSRKQAMIRDLIAGRSSASSTSLSRSCAQPIEQVQSLLRSNGVHDDG